MALTELRADFLQRVFVHVTLRVVDRPFPNLPDFNFIAHVSHWSSCT